MFLEFLIYKVGLKLNLPSLWLDPSPGRGIYLPGGHVVLHRVDGQAENVIVVPQVQPLGVLLPVVHDSRGGDVVDHLSRLRVEQIVPTVVASVPGAQVQERHSI